MYGVEAVPETLFRNRLDAGGKLAHALEPQRDDSTVVVGLARGGVVVAAGVARSLNVPLDALAVRKVRHPWQPEYAIGAVTPDGSVFLRAVDGLTEAEVAQAVTAAQQSAQELDRRLHEHYATLDLTGKSVLAVDDGLATGATMVAATRWARAGGARCVVASAPVGSVAAAALLRAEADRVVCPIESDHFWAVGLWYADFEQVTDQEVLELLHEAATRANAPRPRDPSLSRRSAAQ